MADALEKQAREWLCQGGGGFEGGEDGIRAVSMSGQGVIELMAAFACATAQAIEEMVRKKADEGNTSRYVVLRELADQINALYVEGGKL